MSVEADAGCFKSRGLVYFAGSRAAEIAASHKSL